MREQLRGRGVGYLLGAGASYLDGRGYPLAAELWACIADALPEHERSDIQSKLDGGASGLEHALDLLDHGGVNDLPHRHSVACAIANVFRAAKPPTEVHRRFVEVLHRRPEEAVPVFTLNYDPLVERAADEAGVRVVDGFTGIEHALFTPAVFEHRIGVRSGGTGRRTTRLVRGTIHLFKLHGSLGWYDHRGRGACRSTFDHEPPDGARLLMIPPQRRKAHDAATPPFAQLWSYFRTAITEGRLHRLVVVGYGMHDEHVNSEILLGVARPHFTLVILARSLAEDVWARWQNAGNVILVTQERSALYGEAGPGSDRLWKFETIVEEAG